MDIRVKRVYEPPSPADGDRILVDRLWPRGIRKSDLKGEWVKEIAPSTELRKWFNHEQPKWKDFKKRYFAELKGNAAVDSLRDRARNGRVTLLYAAKDEEQNHALVLKEYLEAT